MKRSWSELNGTQRTFILIGSAVEIALTTAAAIDLVKRPPTAIRGPKPLWFAALLIQPVGPIAYFLAARKPEPVEWIEDFDDLDQFQ